MGTKKTIILILKGALMSNMCKLNQIKSFSTEENERLKNVISTAVKEIKEVLDALYNQIPKTPISVNNPFVEKYKNSICRYCTDLKPITCGQGDCFDRQELCKTCVHICGGPTPCDAEHSMSACPLIGLDRWLADG